ncbi:hypothetical protein LZL87_011574 [Fusarium oxysporum]|nr:hypothetical protein LZL87_011574 [Fusarium oxysporum]
MVVEDPDHGDRRKQTEDTLAPSSNEISSPAFQPFPNLPPELRLQIWKSACFPFTANEPGLHYADLANLPDKNLHEAEDLYWSPIEMITLLPDFQTSPKPLESVGRPNRSVYMWDAGLWKLCCSLGAELEGEWGTVFHDCDGAYVTVDDDYTGCYPTCPEETSETLRFLQCVRELWTAASCEDCSYEETCYDGVFDPDFDISKHFKVLVCHEREVGEGEREDGLVDENDDNEDEIEQGGQEGKGISES